MERYLYFCYKCNFLGSAEHENPNDIQVCSDCKAIMTYTGFTKEEWDSKSKVEKDQIKDEFKNRFPDQKVSYDDPNTNILNKISNDLSVIKNILIGFTAVTLIGVFILLIGMFT